MSAVKDAFFKIKDFFDINIENDRKKSIKYNFLLICFYIFMFQFYLQEHISIFKYWDELYALLFIPLFIINIKNKNKLITFQREDIKIVICCIIITIIGISGNLIYQYQNFGIAVQEIIIIFKFLMSFYTTKILFRGLKIHNNQKLANHSKLLTIFLGIFIILDYIFNIFPHEIRYGLKTEQLFYGHQTGLAAVLIFNLSILLLTDNSNKKVIFIVIDLFMIASTIRSKALGTIIVFVAIYVWCIKLNRKITIKLILIIIISLLLISSKQILYYFVRNVDISPRANLLITSFKIANDNWPLGSGFATIGTNFSGKYYSEVYEKYGIQEIDGLRKNAYNYVSDTFWPAILGQFGYIGLVAYVLILYYIWYKMKRIYKNDREVFIAAFLPFLYLLIASTAESAFMHTIAVPMFFAIGLAIGKEEKPKVEDIIMIDFEPEKNWTFKQSLENSTGIEWNIRKNVSNKPRKNIFIKIGRYLRYFTFPLKIYLERFNLNNIIAWQQFYGLIFAFYCRVLHSKKYNKLVIMTFIYKEKKGIVGKVYYKFMRYVVSSKYIDKMICFSQDECEYYANIFKVDKEKFTYCNLGVEKIDKNPTIDDEKFILSVGRSNRDYEFLIDALKDTDYKVKILSDELKDAEYKNIKIYNNIFGENYYEMLSKCYVVVIPLKDENISSGQLVILQAMQLGKPVICTKSNTVIDYIKNGENGRIVEKDKYKLLEALTKLYIDESEYNRISRKEIEIFNEKYSIDALGKNIAEIFNTI